MKKFAAGVAAIVIIGVFMGAINSNADNWIGSIWRFFFGDDGSGILGSWFS